MSHVYVGDGNKLKKDQLDAIRKKREFEGRSNSDNNDMLDELDGKKESKKNVLAFKYTKKRDAAIEAQTKAIANTGRILEDVSPDGNAYKKHVARKNKLEKDLREIEENHIIE